MKSKLIVLTIVIITIIAIVLIVNSKGRTSVDGITITPQPIDSIETEKQLDKILNGWFVDLSDQSEDMYRYPPLYKRTDLRYLPYLWIMWNNVALPEYTSYMYKWYLSELCQPSTWNKALPKLINQFYSKLPQIYSLVPDYAESHIIHDSEMDEEDEREWDQYWEDYGDRGYIGKELYCIDSLRVRVVAFSDRNALEKLEQYYKERNQPKELAIYYKVMLGHEGNGDLAESYFQVLKPYLKDQPEFINGIRTVLLRAALCDHNARAQELCDSLGFSLCDYRLPRLDE